MALDLWGWFWKLVGWVGNLDVVRDHAGGVAKLATSVSGTNVSYVLFGAGIVWLIAVVLCGDWLSQRVKPWKLIVAAASTMVVLGIGAAWLGEKHSASSSSPKLPQCQHQYHLH